MSQTFRGIVKAKIVEAKFALAGKIAVVNKKKTDRVKKGELLAALDRKILQTELDRQLADYEKTRAEFEIFNLKKGGLASPTGGPDDDITKYLKTQKQAELDASVKEVELAKAKLDQADLFSPIEGIIIDDSNLVPGIYITPSANPFKILDGNSFYLEIEVNQDNLPLFLNPREANLNIPIAGINTKSTSKPITESNVDKQIFFVEIPIPGSQNLIPGMQGEITI